MWYEISSEFFDEEGDVFIYAWRTPDENEVGEALAKITMDGRVKYMNEQAKTNKKVQEAINTARYEQLARKAYGYYKADWCKERGYNIDYVDEEHGVCGECYVCFNEFLGAEFQDEEYMEYLLNHKDFEEWKELVKKR